MERVETIRELRALMATVRAGGQAIGLVATLGALHPGHLAHVEALRHHADHVVLSVFVNPLQFAEGEDFERYPHDLERDADLAEAVGVDTLFSPSAAEMYPPGSETVVEVPGLSSVLEGAIRPTHFRGVATVVAKLLIIVTPQVASFGQKDLQQLLVVRRLVQDLHLPVRVLAVPTVREPDGLALSSRNAYLGPAERARAPGLHRALRAGVDLIRAGVRDARQVEREVAGTLASFPGFEVDYTVVRGLPDLTALKRVRGRVALLGAGRLGRARLLDNVVMEVSDAGVAEVLP